MAAAAAALAAGTAARRWTEGLGLYEKGLCFILGLGLGLNLKADAECHGACLHPLMILSLRQDDRRES